MKKIFLSIVFILVIFIGWACMNEYQPIPGVNKTEDEYSNITGSYVYNVKELQEFIKKKEKDCNNKLDTICNDLAVAYMYNHEYKKALVLCEQLVQKYPNKYSIVINYAVALELNGKYSKALSALREAIKINPASHDYSEWVHEKILENVVANNTNPTKSILGLDFGATDMPRNIKKISTDSIFSLRKMLAYQLNDRLYFVGEHNPIFGSLLYDFACLLSLTGNHNAHEYFLMAKKYGFKNTSIDAKIFYTQTENEYNNDYLAGIKFSNEIGYTSKINDSIVRKSIDSLIKISKKEITRPSLYIAEYYKCLHKYDSALIWSTKVYNKYPNEIRIQREHALLLELNEKNKESLDIIHKLQKQDPCGLGCSYWISSALLEAKINEYADFRQSILRLDFGYEDKPQNADKIDYGPIRNQLEKQIKLRFEFEEKNNPAFSSLVFDYANLVALTYATETVSLKYYRMAKDYGFSDPLVDQRIEFMEKLEIKNKQTYKESIKSKKDNDSDWFIILLCMITIGLGIYLGLKKD